MNTTRPVSGRGAAGMFASALTIAAALAAPTFAVAQDEQAAVEEIVVTASRAARSGFDAPTPTTVVSAEELKLTGDTSIADVLNQVPAFRASRSPATSSSQSQYVGGNFLDLRGLGPSRTLILVDGRRHVPTTQDGLVDINAIPTALIDRVEVVTGGASAAWGSDAVAGVVNLVMKHDWEGLELTAQGGISSEGDAQEYLGSFAFGTAFGGGRGNLMLGGEVFENRGVLHQGDRDWGDDGFQLVANPAYAPGNGEPRRLITRTTLGLATEGGLIVSGPLRGTQFLPGGATAPFTFGQATGPFQIGGDGINLGQYRPVRAPLERQNLFGRATWRLTDRVTAFGEASWSRSASSNKFVQPFDFGSLTISVDNPFLPTAVRDQLVGLGETSFKMGRVNTDFGFFDARAETRTARIVAGLKGELDGGWDWDAWYEYGDSRYHGRILNNRIKSRFALAIDAVEDPLSGDPVCRSTLTDPGNGCVPVNLFGFGAPSAAAIDYVNATQDLKSRFQEHAAAANLRGEPFSTWAGPVAIAAGVEFRSQELDTEVDALSAAGAFFVGNPQPIHPPSLDVSEGYLEAIAPLLVDAPFARKLELNGAVRYTNYSTSGGVTTWKLGVTDDVGAGLRLRTARSRDIRAPNLIELFTSRQLSFDSLIDPATGDQVFIPTPTSGNANLDPEIADTLTLGLVYEPERLKGLRLSVDYYDIEIQGAIATLEAQDIVDRCFAGNASLCALVSRDGNGDLTEVLNAYVNLARLRTKGVDVEASYATPMSAFADGLHGELGLRFLATWVQELVTDDGISSVDRAGDVGTDLGGVPHWRLNASATYRNGPLTLYGEGRWVGGGKVDHTTTLNVDEVDGRFYLDLSAEYAVVDRDDRRVALFASVRNLFDRDPPILPSSSVIPLQTNGALYDTLGRYVTVGVRLRR